MYGRDVASLTLLQRSLDGKEETVWTETGSHGDRWLRKFSTLRPGLFQLIFVATSGRGPRDHIALDDVTIGNCNILSRYYFFLYNL